MTFREQLADLLENTELHDLALFGLVVVTIPLWLPLVLIGFLGACIVAAVHHYMDAMEEVVKPKPCEHERLEAWHDGHVRCLICEAILPAEVCPECLGVKSLFERASGVYPCPRCHEVGSVIAKETP